MAFILGFLLLAGAYLLFAGQPSLSEGIAAGTATLPALFLAAAMRRCSDRRFTLRFPWLTVIAKPLLHLLTETVSVGLTLLRALFGANPTGRTEEQPFARPTDPRSATRRALVTLGISFSPNGYVLHVPPEGDRLILHRLAPQRAATNPEWPL